VVNIVPNRPMRGTDSMIEATTGTSTIRGVGSSSLTGAGVGIAILDSGVMQSHSAFAGANGGSRVTTRVDLTRNPLDPFATGSDLTGVNQTSGGDINSPDGFGHGTLVAAIAAGGNVPGNTESTGIAPGASLVDVRVLDDTGVGDLATVLEGMNWILANAKQKNIKVVNISLGGDSTDSYLDDPLCNAVRTAVASGITVVVAAGNYGQSAAGLEVFGTVSSPGNEPSAITVGSVNMHNTADRSDDTVNFFSSRGPTRGTFTDAAGTVYHDNLLKPDLVAPGNRVVGAVSSDASGNTLSALATQYPELVIQSQPKGTGLMFASGTSFAAPVVAGTVALMLEANPGLTPPLIKAMLQYSAQPVQGNLLQAGAGLLNVPGTISIAQALRTDISSRIAAGTLSVGDSLLAPDQSFPSTTSTINGGAFSWGRAVVLGGRHIYTGRELFKKYQAIWDPELLWVGNTITTRDVQFDGAGAVTGTTDSQMNSGNVLSSGVIYLDGTLGPSSYLLNTGIFTPISQLMALIDLGGGSVNSQVMIVSEGMIVNEGFIVSEGMIVTEGMIVNEGFIVSEGAIVSEGSIVSEALHTVIPLRAPQFGGEN